MRDITPAPRPVNSADAATQPRSPWGWMGVCGAALLAACAAPLPPPPPPPPPPAQAPAPAAPPVVARPMPKLVSHAVSPMDYRKDGAKHIYGSNGHRIYKGKMPPLLQGVGVMQLEIDELGNIRHLNWLRPPSHAGSRMEIERTVRAAAPFPAPVRMGRVSYTDTWLWHESGQFQLDTLTEGQRDK